MATTNYNPCWFNQSKPLLIDRLHLYSMELSAVTSPVDRQWQVLTPNTRAHTHVYATDTNTNVKDNQGI